MHRVLVFLIAMVLWTAASTAGEPCTAGKSGTNWLRHYEDACPTLRAAAVDCSLCHVTVEELNPYGIDLATVDNLPWLIDDLDSDRDGRTNLEEIGDCTLPGDRDSVLPLLESTWSLLKQVWR